MRAMNEGENAAGESEPSVTLRLGIGTGECARVPATVKAAKEEFPHLTELYDHSLVYKCLAARLPVPRHLLQTPVAVNVVVPKFPPPHMGFGREANDYTNRMSPEPERCRRTDGKKWRCRKTIVPNQKYCERHVNRGRQRSRKPVEVSKIASPSVMASKTANHDLGNSKGDIPLGLRLDTGLSPNAACENKSTLKVNDGYRAYVSSASSSSSGLRTSLGSWHLKYQCRNFVDDRREHLPGNRVNVNNCFRSGSVLPGLDFSPGSSVLQGNFVAERPPDERINNDVRATSELLAPLEQRATSCSAPLQPKMEMEMEPQQEPWKCRRIDRQPEPWRCRRTDGKQWRCRRDILPGQKYCSQHIHRGSKTNPQAQPLTAINLTRPPATFTTARSSKRAKLSTSLSISAPAARRKDEKTGGAISGSESDVTLSDTTVAA